jgi:hypothetical protein
LNGTAYVGANYDDHFCTDVNNDPSFGKWLSFGQVNSPDGPYSGIKALGPNNYNMLTGAVNT